MRTHSPNETRSDPPCCGFIAQLLERRSDQEELTVTLSSQILTETRPQVDRAPMASASAQDRVSFASGLARSERGERWTRRLFKRMGIFYVSYRRNRWRHSVFFDKKNWRHSCATGSRRECMTPTELIMGNLLLIGVYGHVYEYVSANGVESCWVREREHFGKRYINTCSCVYRVGL